MFVKSNNLKDVKAFFVQALISEYEEREANNIFFYINDVLFGRNRVEALSLRCGETELLFWNSTVKKLISGIPIQYVLGKADFYNLVFYVDENTLIPRPETEELVDLILKENSTTFRLVLDIGTGSGCIATALKVNRNKWEVVGCDVSKKALIKARESADLNNASVDFIELNILSPTLKLEKEWDIIVSNPPYIPQRDKKEMAKQVIDFEPDTALFVDDENPLIFYSAIADYAQQYLKSGGKLYFEIHELFGQAVKNLLMEKNFNEIQLFNDLQQKNRMVSAIKQ